jgi:hypothetical protein
LDRLGSGPRAQEFRIPNVSLASDFISCGDHSNFLAVVKVALAFVVVEPFERSLIDVSDEDAYNDGTFFRDNVRAATI